LNILFCKYLKEKKTSTKSFHFKSRNPNEAVPTRIDVLTTVFDKYLWFKMTDQVNKFNFMMIRILSFSIR
jgi:hypothetical protein